MSTQNFMGQEEIPLTAPTPDEKTMGILSHILCLVGGFVAPLIIYLIKKDESAYVKEQSKEALNFMITVAICYVISWFLVFVFFIGVLLMMIIGIGTFILIILATIKASEGKIYRYPVNLRLVK